ncbi:MAG TPA: hypothetical protein VK772_05255 [Puia sp.]|nr:hypothetical protein [Puia sp.]
MIKKIIKKIKIYSLALFSVLIFFSCAKKWSRKDTETVLKNTMDQYLNHSPKIDSSRVKFKVLDVIYFEEEQYYRCNFQVNMKEKMSDHLLDTTGAMNAKISKDFKTVSRIN